MSLLLRFSLFDPDGFPAGEDNAGVVQDAIDGRCGQCFGFEMIERVGRSRSHLSGSVMQIRYCFPLLMLPISCVAVSAV